MKPLCVIKAPFATRSGYGEMARDIISHIMDLDKYEVKLISLAWGMTPMNALDLDDPHHRKMFEATVSQANPITRQPDLFLHITVPNEFEPMGKYNIGITAGIETTACSLPWIEGCNRMHAIWTISEHSKRVFDSTVAEMRNQQGQIVKTVKVDKPVEVLHNCVHTDTFKKIAQGEIEETVDDALLVVKEKFNFLFVGHWLNGDFGHDRKNIAMLIRVFCETFKNTVTAKRPGLILKTSGAGFSILDRERLLKKIRDIRVASGPNAPNVYLLHGDLSEKEMNSLFNHPKIKVHVNLTHGEGFGRPLLEASMSEKPIIASGWSGHLDFLNKDDAVLVGGELQNVHPSAVWQDVILAESQWFMPDPNQAASAMAFIFEKYSEWLPKSKKLAATNKEQFSYKKIFERTKELVEKYVPEFAIQAPLKLPSLKKLGEKSKPELNAQPIKLPTLKKLGEPVKVE